MQYVFLTTGLPGSGKTTWAKAKRKAAGDRIVLTSRDDIRKMLGCFPVGTKEEEDLVSKIQDNVIVSAVKAGKSVVVHDTNLNSKSPTRIKKLFDGDVEFAIADFTEVPVEVCIERDAQRENPVGEKVIRNMARQLQKPWRLTPEFMNDVTLSEPLEYDPELPWAIVIDTDGTTAHHNRSPYDYARCYTDTPDPNMRMLVRIIYEQGAYDTIKVLGMSGRPDTWRDMTELWYKQNKIPFDELYMRKEGDSRNDADVKQEMVDQHIRGKYNVLMWFDDRDRVVRRLRKLGIKVSQVAEGDF
jgi:predicted kinase